METVINEYLNRQLKFKNGYLYSVFEHCELKTTGVTISNTLKTLFHIDKVEGINLVKKWCINNGVSENDWKVIEKSDSIFLNNNTWGLPNNFDINCKFKKEDYNLGDLVENYIGLEHYRRFNMISSEMVKNLIIDEISEISGNNLLIELDILGELDLDNIEEIIQCLGYCLIVHYGKDYLHLFLEKITDVATEHYQENSELYQYWKNLKQ